ncbi:hypothetical protein ACFXPV_09365 [Streptomyces sp. NPDC059118]|uniref:hypothetical protein n=1 Tax=unclassified Streptomyces TaxID=2593676 RepID=UPI0036B78D14
MQAHTTGPAPVVDTRRMPLREGSASAVFAEGRDPLRWRESIPNTLIADSARLVLDRAVARAGSPIASLTFSGYRRFDVDGDRAVLQAACFERRRRLWDAAIAAMLSDAFPVREVEDLIWAVCDEYAWALPAHIRQLSDPEADPPHDEVVDLYAAETAFALTEITTLLRERLHPLVVRRALREVERRVLTPFREREWWWESIETNWSAVCAAGVGPAAMYLEADDLAAVLVRCDSAMATLLAGYGDDGVCREGLAYWTYGFGHFTMYAEALRQRTGIDLWDEEKVARIAGFAGEVSLGGTAVAAFSDTPAQGSVSPAMVSLLEQRFPAAPRAPRALWQHDPTAPGNWGLAVRAFVRARTAPEPAPATPPPDRWSADAQ